MAITRMLLDVEVQKDFFSPGGSCYKPEAAAAARNVQALFAWAQRNAIPVLSTVLRVRDGRRGPLAEAPHCVEGTFGEQRLEGTVLPRSVDLGIRNTTDLPSDLFSQFQQVIIEKRYTDIFSHARAERLLTELEADTFIVCGAGSAHGIVEAVVGLRQRGFGVILAADAILDLGHPRAEMAWLRMTAKGAVPLATEEIIGVPAHSAKRRRGAVPLARPHMAPRQSQTA